ncbi:hypothetical protein Tco_0210739 [Tanacetum coccineum]
MKKNLNTPYLKDWFVDISKQTIYSEAFTASSTIPSYLISTILGYYCALKIISREAISVTGMRNEFDLTMTHQRRSSDNAVDIITEDSHPPQLLILLWNLSISWVSKGGLTICTKVNSNDMLQNRGGLSQHFNLGLSGKNSGFERPRATGFKSFGCCHSRLQSIMLKECGRIYFNPIHTFTEDL